MQLVIVRHGQSTNNAGYVEAVAAGLAAGGKGVGGKGAGDRGSGQVAPGAAMCTATGTVQEWHFPGRVADPALSALGVRQAETLGRAMAQGRTAFVPTHLYASPTTRAVQTARPLAEATGLPVTVHPDAYEVGGIHLFDPRTATRRARPGATLQELRDHCPHLEGPARLFETADGRWSGGLETHDDQALPRAVRMLASLRRAHGDDDVVLVVSHQYFSQFVVAAVFDRPGPPWRRFRLDNTAHLSLDPGDGGRPGDGVYPGDGGAFVHWINRIDHLDPADVTN